MIMETRVNIPYVGYLIYGYPQIRARSRGRVLIRSLNSHIVSISVPDATQTRVFRRIAEGFEYNVNNIRVTSTHPTVDSKHNEALTTFRVHYMSLDSAACSRILIPLRDVA